ncbi:hypothetical protein EWM64_g7831 [Hericium alpestre]|uniref:Uncharacterized protein n=1 Tax=Hericium alpestre TaxID=135208 RepID=A0A4Y9ZQ80_9AGAM|nr:hypothetical protein EWM64_g7831 [Hericium alpestre]
MQSFTSREPAFQKPSFAPSPSSPHGPVHVHAAMIITIAARGSRTAAIMIQGGTTVGA